MKSVILALQMAGEPGRRKLSGVLDYVLEKKCQWNIRFVRHREEVSPDFVRRLSAHPVDGILYSFDNVHAVETELAKIAIPTVVLDLYGSSPIFKRTKNISFVSSDCQATGHAAADFLLDSGVCRSFAFVPDVHHRAWGHLRGHAFIDHIGKHGFRTAVYRRPKGVSCDLAELSAWLKSLPKPCGVFAAFDDRALDVLEACRAAGLAVPDEIAVVGVDNDTLLCEHTIPAITSVQPDHAAVGRLAAEILCEMMETRSTKHARRETCAGAQLVARETTPSVSNAGRLVQKAVAYIHANATKGIGVRDVVAHSLSARSLTNY